MSMRFGSAMPALHEVSDTGRGVSGGSRGGGVGEKDGGAQARLGWGAQGGLGWGAMDASDGGPRETSDGGPQMPLMGGSWGDLGAASEVSDFCPGLSFPPLASLEGP